uniref:Putative tail tubular protein n=1 Tax=viral metagenome TaxID=1070528 RepID=A0A6M3XLV0_9ZZZZ
MSASEVQICNLALLKFGTLTITELGPLTKESRACAVFYPLLRDQLVYSHPWNFAMKRADISAPLADTPAFEWDYAYTLPADCMRVWELYGTDAEWVVESGQLLTNLDKEIYIRYIRQVTTTGNFNPSFVNCLGTLLGAELAAKLAGDNKLRISLLEELHKIQLPAAYVLNAMEGNRPRHKDEQPIDEGNFSWQTEGR